MQKVLHVKDLAAHFGVEVSKARRMMHEMSCINIGTPKKPMWVVEECEVERWMERKTLHKYQPVPKLDVIPRKRPKKVV